MCQAKPPLTRLAASRSRLAGVRRDYVAGPFLGLGGFDGMALCLTLYELSQRLFIYVLEFAGIEFCRLRFSGADP